MLRFKHDVQRRPTRQAGYDNTSDFSPKKAELKIKICCFFTKFQKKIFMSGGGVGERE